MQYQLAVKVNKSLISYIYILRVKVGEDLYIHFKINPSMVAVDLQHALYITEDRLKSNFLKQEFKFHILKLLYTLTYQHILLVVEEGIFSR